MKNPFAKRSSSPAPETLPAPAPAPVPQPQERYTAVSNLSWNGLPPGWITDASGNRLYREGDTETFTTLQAAVQWLKAKRCGGSVSDGTRIMREVLPGEQ